MRNFFQTETLELSVIQNWIGHNHNILYARHYNPRFVYFLPTLWSPKTCSQGFFFLKILALFVVSIQEQFLIKSGLWWRAYGIRIYWDIKLLKSLLSTFQNQFKLDYGPLGQNNMYIPRPARKKMNVPLQKRTLELTVLMYILWPSP